MEVRMKTSIVSSQVSQVEGQSLLAEKMKNFSVDINEIDDPFSSDEDSEEAENEVCIDEDNGDSSDCDSS